MDFSWPQSHIDFKQDLIAFAQKELNDNLIERDAKGEFSRENWLKCAEFGIQGLSVTSAYGGHDEKVDLPKAMLAMEGFGYGCNDNGLALALNAQMWTVQLPIAEFGSEELKTSILTKLVNGSKIACHALTEPEAGSDIYSMAARAEKVEGGYLLNASKRLITFAPIADIALVFAITNPKMGKWGITAFLVETNSEGVTASPVRDKMGMRTVPIGELDFKDCFVPEENRLGAEGAGFSIMNHSLEYDKACILASQLGAMERQLEDTVSFVKKRNQFGQSIGKFQSVANRIADMKLRLETARLLLYKVAWLKDQGENALMESAMLKLHLGESFVQSSLDAIRSRGGNGFLTEFEVERDLRDSIGGILYAGTSDIQRNIISRLLGL
ncbi:acyl-CoA dehydrogenase family protein [Roseivirga sp.]|uniref:acyl-CoA dehydrogenase family protein n=1 Tax=Roseivirga sp. TaxID=1964215 RepID=UPI003B8BCF3E